MLQLAYSNEDKHVRSCSCGVARVTVRPSVHVANVQRAVAIKVADCNVEPTGVVCLAVFGRVCWLVALCGLGA